MPIVLEMQAGNRPIISRVRPHSWLMKDMIKLKKFV